MADDQAGARPRGAGWFGHAFLLRELVRRDFLGRYAGSLMGFLWSFVQPLWQLLLFTFVFSVVMRIPMELVERTDRFAVFLFCGLLPWMAVQEGVLRGATSITDNAELVKKLRFPSEMLVVTVVVTALLHQAIAGGLFLVVLLALGELDPRGLPWLLLAVPLQTALVLGLALALSAIHVFLRDTAQALGMALQAWFFLTPIVYPLALVPERYQAIPLANPLTALVELYRAAFLGGGVAVPGGGLAILVASAAVALGLGLWLFRRAKLAFVDEM